MTAIATVSRTSVNAGSPACASHRSRAWWWRRMPWVVTTCLACGGHVGPWPTVHSQGRCQHVAEWHHVHHRESARAPDHAGPAGRRFDFGLKLPDDVLSGGQRQVDIELGEVIFTAGTAKIPEGRLRRCSIASPQPYANTAVAAFATIVASAHAEALAFERAVAVQAELAHRLDTRVEAKTRIEVTTEVEPTTPLVSLQEEIGLSHFLFDTDKSVIRPQIRQPFDRPDRGSDQCPWRGLVAHHWPRRLACQQRLQHEAWHAAGTGSCRRDLRKTGPGRAPKIARRNRFSRK